MEGGHGKRKETSGVKEREGGGGDRGWEVGAIKKSDLKRVVVPGHEFIDMK